MSRPFAPHALVPIREASDAGDLDRVVELVNTAVSGFPSDYVDALRSQPAWSELRSFAPPLATELEAIHEFEPSYDAYPGSPVPVTLLLGEQNEGAEPYGVAFDRFRTAMPGADVVVLPGQGHLAHVTAPQLLATAVSEVVAGR